MIPHEKIEQAAYDYSFTQRSEYDSKSILERKDIKLYYKDGVRFAEAELKRMQSCSTCHVTEVITDGICNVCGAEQNITKQ